MHALLRVVTKVSLTPPGNMLGDDGVTTLASAFTDNTCLLRLELDRKSTPLVCVMIAPLTAASGVVQKTV